MGAHIVKNNDDGANGMLKCEVSRRLSLVFNEMRKSDNNLGLLNARLKLTA
jgi:hypothetical protein